MPGSTSAAHGLIGTMQRAAVKAAQVIAALQAEVILVEIAPTELISDDVLREVGANSRHNPESVRLDSILIVIIEHAKYVRES